jgi:Carboxypeptidase regulatory-like domain
MGSRSNVQPKEGGPRRRVPGSKRYSIPATRLAAPVAAMVQLPGRHCARHTKWGAPSHEEFGRIARVGRRVCRFYRWQLDQLECSGRSSQRKLLGVSAVLAGPHRGFVKLCLCVPTMSRISNSVRQSGSTQLTCSAIRKLFGGKHETHIHKSSVVFALRRCLRCESCAKCHRSRRRKQRWSRHRDRTESNRSKCDDKGKFKHRHEQAPVSRCVHQSCLLRRPIMTRGWNLLSCFLLLLIGCTLSVAQTITGSITGTVIDAGGAVVTGATVTASNVATGVSVPTQTNGTGVYSLKFLPIGQYTVAVTAAGF